MERITIVCPSMYSYYFDWNHSECTDPLECSCRYLGKYPWDNCKRHRCISPAVATGIAMIHDQCIEPIDTLRSPDRCPKRVCGDGFRHCEEHGCGFQCRFPCFDGSYGDNRKGPYCAGIESNRCRGNATCEFHHGCGVYEDGYPCRFIRCPFPGCNPCLSHMEVCGYCYNTSMLTCAFHDACLCGLPKRRTQSMCSACALSAHCGVHFCHQNCRLCTLNLYPTVETEASSSYLQRLPMEMLVHIEGFVAQGLKETSTDGCWWSKTYELHPFKTRGWITHRPHDLERLLDQEECQREEHHAYYEQLTEFGEECVAIEDRFFNHGKGGRSRTRAIRAY